MLPVLPVGHGFQHRNELSIGPQFINLKLWKHIRAEIDNLHQEKEALISAHR